jgi:hypothetical protein
MWGSEPSKPFSLFQRDPGVCIEQDAVRPPQRVLEAHQRWRPVPQGMELKYI